MTCLLTGERTLAWRRVTKSFLNDRGWTKLTEGLDKVFTTDEQHRSEICMSLNMIDCLGWNLG